jgi:hypothetical protein
MKRGRPVSPLLAVECHIHLRLRVGEDDDLIAFLNTLPARRRASTIKSALRNGGMGFGMLADDNSDDDLLAAINDFLK